MEILVGGRCQGFLTPLCSNYPDRHLPTGGKGTFKKHLLLLYEAVMAGRCFCKRHDSQIFLNHLIKL